MTFITILYFLGLFISWPLIWFNYLINHYRQFKLVDGEDLILCGVVATMLCWVWPFTLIYLIFIKPLSQKIIKLLPVINTFLDNVHR